MAAALYIIGVVVLGWSAYIGLQVGGSISHYEAISLGVPGLDEAASSIGTALFLSGLISSMVFFGLGRAVQIGNEIADRQVRQGSGDDEEEGPAGSIFDDPGPKGATAPKKTKAELEAMKIAREHGCEARRDE